MNREYLSIERIAADNGITVADVEAAVAGGALAVEPVFGKRCALKSNVIAWLAAGKPRTGAAAPAPRPTPAITPTLASSSRPDDGRAEVFASAAEQLGLDADEVIAARDVAATRRGAPATYQPPAYSAPNYEPEVDAASVLASVANQLELDPHELATNNRTIAGRRRVRV